MAAQRLIAVLVGLGLLVALAGAASLTLGRREARDGLVCSSVVNIRGQSFRVVSATRVCNVPRYNQNITYISAQDLGGRRGGYAKVSKGGIGQKNVTLYLWSQPGQPLNFTVNIYAKPYW